MKCRELQVLEWQMLARPRNLRKWNHANLKLVYAWQALTNCLAAAMLSQQNGKQCDGCEFPLYSKATSSDCSRLCQIALVVTQMWIHKSGLDGLCMHYISNHILMIISAYIVYQVLHLHHCVYFQSALLPLSSQQCAPAKLNLKH